MKTNRLEAFSDGILAIAITIMVLDLKIPRGQTEFADLLPMVPIFLSYILSYFYIGIYWNNHHHLMQGASKVNGSVLWANLHLLFWLSLIPFVTGWMGENHFEAAPTVLYGIVLLMSAISYLILQNSVLRLHGDSSLLANAIGRDFKGKATALLYLVAIPLAFHDAWVARGVYFLVALMWIVPDKRIEKALEV